MNTNRSGSDTARKGHNIGIGVCGNIESGATGYVRGINFCIDGVNDQVTCSHNADGDRACGNANP